MRHHQSPAVDPEDRDARSGHRLAPRPALRANGELMPATNRLAAMEAFVRVLDAGSFCAAARQLKIGQPAVSKSVAQLERRLGVRLLMRSTRGVSSTEAGRKF